jgi:TolA-binding protein
VSRGARGLLLALTASTLAGCVATQQDVLGLSQQTDDLKSQVDDLKKTVVSMQANQADLAVHIQQLREDLSAYSETVKASQGDMGQLSSKLDALGVQISGKMTQLGATLGASLSAAQLAQQKGLAEQRSEIEAQGRETAATELLVTSQNRLEAKDFALAAAGFEDYLKRFPGGDLTDVTLYDLGLSYFGLKQWAKAGQKFALLLDKYPKSGQTPGARLHYARCLLQLGKGRDEAVAYLQSIKTDFPKTPEAVEAAAELKRLAPKPASKAAAAKRPAAPPTAATSPARTTAPQ